MKIKIYQINTDRDNYGCAFMGMEWLKKAMGTDTPDSTIYDRVFEGEIRGTSPEDVYARFNWDLPSGYRGRPLSVSDVVEIGEGAEVEPGFYFCESIGFKKVDFDASLASVREDKITVVFLEPGKLARIEQIDASLEGLQGAVGGYIEAMYPFEEQVCVICNEEGKINGKIIARYEDGLRPEEIAKKMGISVDQVNAVLEEGDNLDYTIDESTGICDLTIYFDGNARNLEVLISRISSK